MEKLCVLFDLDGTLLDTLDDLCDAVNAGLAAAGAPPRGRGEVLAFVGNGIGMLLQRALPQDATAAQKAACAEAFYRFYEAHCCDRTKPYTGIAEAVAEMRAAGHVLGVVSNKKDAAVQRIVQRLAPGWFDGVTGERAGIPRKPDPTLIYTLCGELGCAAAQAVYIGDSEVDTETARRAGLPFIGCAWGFRGAERLRAEGASVIAMHPRELPGLLSRACVPGQPDNA